MKSRALAIAVLLIGCAQQPPAASSTFALDKGATSGFPVPFSGPYRVTVDAEQPVTVALVSQVALARWRRDGSKPAPSQTFCLRSGIVKSTLDCAPPVSVELVVTDERTPAGTPLSQLETVAGVAVTLRTGNDSTATANVSRNRVSLTVTPAPPGKR